jgi:uncharacterized membrane protein YeaQ/YmgE (transglycosylase-associated protein family)
MEILGFLVVGLIAGTVSGWFIGVRAIDSFIPSMVVGMVGGVLGGWLSRQAGAGQPQGFMGAVLFAIVGAIAIRIVLKVLEGRR